MGSLLSSFYSPPPIPAAAAAKDAECGVAVLHTLESWDAHWNAHWNDPKSSDEPMVIYFTASWSVRCRLIDTVFRALSVKYTDVAFAKIDVYELSEVSRKWEVQAMPTFVLVKGGKEVGRVVGSKRDELEGKIIQLSQRS